MNAAEAKRLKIGDALIWENDPGDRGTVIEVGYCAVKIEWENGQIGVLHTNDCQSVKRQGVES